MAQLAAGGLDQRITLERVERESDGGGGWSETWVKVADLWGRVEPLTGAEKMAAQQAQSTVSYRVTIRWREGLDAALRLRWRGRVFNVLAVGDAGPRVQHVVLDCEVAGVADG